MSQIDLSRQLDLLDQLDTDEEDQDTLNVDDEETNTSLADELRRLDELEDQEESDVQDIDVQAETPNNITSQLDALDALDNAEEGVVDIPIDPSEPAETPVDEYARTGEVPAGFRVVPSVPTGDAPEDYLPKLERIDAPTPTVSEQTDAVFDFDKTRDMIAAMYGEQGNRDFIDSAAFEEKVPAPLRSTVKAVAGLGEEGLALLIAGVTAVSETVEDTGEAFTRYMHETFTEDNKLLGKTGKELLPFDPKTAGRKFGTDLTMMLEMAEAVVPGAAGAGVARKTFREAKQIEKAKKRSEAAREKLLNRKMNINRAKDATAEEVTKKADEAAEIADQNDDLRQALIEDFELSTGKTISDEVDGKKVLNADKAREAGRETAKELDAGDTRTRVQRALGSDVELDDAALLAGQEDKITMPVLKSDKLNGLVAAAAELKDRNPNAFAPKKFEDGKEYRLIDHLFDLTIDKELIPGDELIDILNKYNVSFEDYILTVVGSGSEAGKTLQKLSQIKRARPLNEMQELQRVATQAQQGKIRNNIMRIEGIRRGGLVSQLATAARNVTSAGIRAPLDTLTNVMDTALYNAGEATGVARKTAAFTGTVLSRSNWNDSFRHMRYMFGPESRLDTKDYVDFILNRPELSKQFDLMFNQLNELQSATGRGMARKEQVDNFIAAAKQRAKDTKTKFDAKKVRQEAEAAADKGILGGKFSTLGRGTDTVLSELEDAVSVLNSANRYQEYLVRRGSFLGELERLVKREYKIDLIDTINNGQIRDLLNDSTTVRPKGARSFMELVADSTNKALDVTYAKQPETPLFREITNFITRNGLTVAIPFPRFMFNSLELMGNYMGGASIPLTKKLMGQLPKGTKLSAADRRRISRNLVGMAGVYAAYQARSTEDAPADYKELSMGDGTVMDTTPQFPLRQYLYLGEATKRLMDGTFDDFFKGKEFSETFLGTNVRTGVGNSIIEEVVNLAGGGDLTRDEALARATARALGNYLSTWAVPGAQIIDTQRAIGMRGEEFRDTAQDPTLTFGRTFTENLKQPLRARGFLTSGKEDEQLPLRQSLFQEEPSRVGSAFKVGLGLSLKTRDSEQGEYIKRLGISEFELGSSSKVPSIRRFENEQLREIIPGLVDAAQAYEKQSIIEYNENESLQKEMTAQEFVNSRVKALIKEQVKSVKRLLSDGKSISADAPAYTEAMLAYRRLPREIRKNAASEFIARNGRPADGAKIEDLYELATIGKVLRSVYK